MPLACITGAAGGLGKAFVLECAQRGYDLFITDIDESALLTLADSVRRSYCVDVYAHACNLADEISRQQLRGKLIKYSGKFDMLINVAGIDFEGMFSTLGHKQIKLLLRLNIEATVEVAAMLLTLRRLNGVFRIINVSSLAAIQPMPHKALYAASKRFLLDWSCALGEELRGDNVTVTALCPAGMPTNAECIESINSQGFAGVITTQNVNKVAALTIKKALNGRQTVIPGLVNRVISILSAHIPQRIVTRIVGRRWSKTRERIACGEVLIPRSS